jgi:hypothetical protein
MKNLLLLAVSLVALTSCGVHSSNKKTQQFGGTTKSLVRTSSKDTSLVAEMQIQNKLKPTDSLLLIFTVKNNTGESKRFCKWHTPFEPLMSKYLDIKDENGLEASYKGAMARRMMPAPESSYITLNAGDSTTVKVDPRKGYALDKSGKYTISYSGQGISGLVVKDSVSFVYLN